MTDKVQFRPKRSSAGIPPRAGLLKVGEVALQTEPHPTLWIGIEGGGVELLEDGPVAAALAKSVDIYLLTSSTAERIADLEARIKIIGDWINNLEQTSRDFLKRRATKERDDTI